MKPKPCKFPSIPIGGNPHISVGVSLSGAQRDGSRRGAARGASLKRPLGLVGVSLNFRVWGVEV